MNDTDSPPPSWISRLSRRSLLGKTGIEGIAAGLLVMDGTQGHAHPMIGQPASDQVDSAPSGQIAAHEFELLAQEFDWEVSTGTVVRAWGYNGQVPGPELRVREGDEVRVRLRNELSVPTTIHWHGVNVHPSMDGVAGLSQAAVEPGAEFLYEFIARPAGSRWYHSHTDPALQVPMGMYGSLIVEPRQPIRTWDREFTYIFAEWDLELTPDVAAGRAPRGTGDQMLRGGELGGDLYLMNGRSHGMIPTMVVREGDRVLIRLMNAGHQSHSFHTHGHSFRIVATDGNAVPVGMEWTKDTVLIGPAERYDLEMTCDNPGVWMVHCHMEHHMANGMMTLIQYEGYQPTGPAAAFIGTPEAAGPHDHTMPKLSADTPAATPVGIQAATTPGFSGTTAEIGLVDDRIDPSDLTVIVGTTVTWVNQGADWHSVAAYDGSFDSARIAPGESYAYRFDQPGTYQYLCKHHAMQGMIGRIEVT